MVNFHPSSIISPKAKIGKNVYIGPNCIITDNVELAVKNAKAGQVELKNDKDGNIGLSLGKKSFTDDKILSNFNAVIDTLEKEKGNNSFKGEMIKTIFLTSTMGISYKLKLDKHF